MIQVRRDIPIPETVEELQELVRHVATRAADEAVELGWRARHQEDPEGRMAPAKRFEEDPLDASVDALIFVGMHLMKLGIATADAIRGEVDDPPEDESPYEGSQVRTRPSLSLEGLRRHVSREDVEVLQRLYSLGARYGDPAYQLTFVTDCSKEAAHVFLQELGLDVSVRNTDAEDANPG